MKSRIAALLLIFVLITATAVCSSAYGTDIPVLYVPETRCFRMALELPEQVGSDSEFTASASIAKLYKGFDGKGITVISGALCYDGDLFSVSPSVSSTDGYTVTVTPSGFTVTLKAPATAETLTEIRFGISMNAKHVTDELMTSIERVYVYLDNVSASGDEVYEGIGAIGYTEFVFAEENASSDVSEVSEPVSAEQSVESYDESCDESIDESSSKYSEEYSCEYSDEFSEPDISDEASEEKPSETGAEELFKAFLDKNRLTMTGSHICGFPSGVDAAEIMKMYPDITVLHYSDKAAKTGLVSTDDILLVFDDYGSLLHRFTCIIKGDVDRDGDISAGDYIALRMHLLKKRDFSAAQLVAADIDGNGRINAADYIFIRRHLLGIYDIFERRVLK